MSEDKAYVIRKIIRFGTPSDYRKHILEATRREVGIKIFDVLWTNRLPAVVDIEESIFTDHTLSYFYETPDEVLEYKVSISPVQYKHVVVRVADYSLFSVNIKERVKFWIKKTVKHLLNWQSRSSS